MTLAKRSGRAIALAAERPTFSAEGRCHDCGFSSMDQFSHQCNVPGLRQTIAELRAVVYENMLRDITLAEHAGGGTYRGCGECYGKHPEHEDGCWVAEVLS